MKGLHKSIKHAVPSLSFCVSPDTTDSHHTTGYHHHHHQPPIKQRHTHQPAICLVTAMHSLQRRAYLRRASIAAWQVLAHDVGPARNLFPPVGPILKHNPLMCNHAQEQRPRGKSPPPRAKVPWKPTRSRRQIVAFNNMLEVYQLRYGRRKKRRRSGKMRMGNPMHQCL